jgi:DNA-binding CsgD family transcriptional regulator
MPNIIDAIQSIDARHSIDTVAPGANLTRRETDCLRLLANGKTNAGIGGELRISVSTVAMHLQNARRKLGAATREQAVAIAVHKGVVGM